MPSAVWYARRLAAMSPREILFRVRRAAKVQLERVPALTGPVPVPDPGSLEGRAGGIPRVDPEPYCRKADRLLQGRLDVFACRDWFLGDPPDWNRDPKTGRSAPRVLGKLIDYRDEALVGNIKYLWEPSRHLMLPSLSQAYRLTGDRKYGDGLVRLLDSWIEQCPWPLGIHWCSALEAGIRLINWSLTWRITGGIAEWRQVASETFLERWLGSIFRHVQFIDGYYSGHSSANNHLIGEAAGVYIATLTWPAWARFSRYRSRAREILCREVESQTHADGVNREQAIAYQQFVLDFFLLAGLAAAEAGEPFPESWWDKLEDMLEFIAAIMDNAGNVPMIGDADDGFVTDLAAEPDFCNYRSLLATGAILFRRPDFAAKAGELDSKSRWLLPDAEERYRAAAHRTERRAARREFPHGGYYVLGSALEEPDEVRIVFDAGPLGLEPLAAHGHADALSFTLSVSGTPMIIDPGTYAYHTDPKWRDWFRGTAAHNTVRIDGLDQSVIGGNFMWTTRAKANVVDCALGGDLQVVEASHDGYGRLSDPVTHRRRLVYDAKARSLRIEDRLECAGEHRVEINFHLPEYVVVEQGRDQTFVRARGQCLRMESEHGLEAGVEHAREEPPLGWVSYHFDRKLPAYTLRFSGRIDGSATFVTVIAVG